MKNSTRNFILIGCSGVGLVVFLAIGRVLRLIFSAPQSREITEADAATFRDIGIAADEGQDKNSIF